MPSAAETIPSIVCRDIAGLDEIRALEDLQIETWGEDPRDIVPLNQFVAARHVGGTLIGAFDGEKVVGFVYGFYGQISGRMVHHSHMLGVIPSHRRHDLGFRLKAAQRERILADAIADRITWTFDPLQSLNAHFNFAKLGVISDTYKINVYGEQATSFLHRNGTDRLFVTWPLNGPRVRVLVSGSRPARENRIPPDRSITRLLRNSDGQPERVAEPGEMPPENFAAIEIPAEINTIERSNFDLARRWREETRRAFSEAISAGFVVVDYFLENDQTGYYILERTWLDEAAAR